MKLLSSKDHADVIGEWDALACLRFEQMSTGLDVTYSNILIPEMLDLIKPIDGRTILDVGCGVGILTARLATYAMAVTGIDPSEASINLARQAIQKKDNLEFLNLSVETYAGEYKGKVDAAVANMVLSSVVDLRGFLGAVSRVVKKNGVFAFSLPHPCFWPSYFGYESHPEFCYDNQLIVEAPFRITNDRLNSLQSTHVHRPISMYVSEFVSAGMEIRMLREPLPGPDVARLYPERWSNPRYLFGLCEVV